MKPVLFTINVGDVLSDNARRSFLAACNRWGFSYLEVTGSSRFHVVGAGKTAHPCFTKFEVFAELQVPSFYVDADVLIPASFESSPLEQFDGEVGVYGVLDAQSHYTEAQRNDISVHVHEVHYDLVHQCMSGPGADRRLSKAEYMRWPINGGVLVCPSPSNRVSAVFRDMMSGAGKAIQQLGTVNNGHIEQAFLNYALESHGIRGTIPECWNRIAPPTTGRVPRACLHFTGPDYLTPETRRQVVKSFDWASL